MNPLVEHLIGILKMNPAVKSVRIVNYDETPGGKLEAKIRCRLVREHHMQIWLHHGPAFQDYAYQLFTERIGHLAEGKTIPSGKFWTVVDRTVWILFQRQSGTGK